MNGPRERVKEVEGAQNLEFGYEIFLYLLPFLRFDGYLRPGSEN